MRPFLPVVPAAEYVELAALAKPFVDVILGEVWYADKGGLLEKQVFGTAGSSGVVFEEHKMDFDSNDAICHGLIYLKRAKHYPTLVKHWPMKAVA